ncbi:MAG: hypothetical protein ABSG98_00385 [Anaerolineales bacterium]|jgi:hypothetical protein
MADERAVRQALDRSSEAIRVGQLQSLLRVEVELHEEAERESRAVKLELIRLLETVAPDQAEADLSAGPSVETLSAKELISILQSRLIASGAKGDRLADGPRETAAGVRSKDYQALRNELGTTKEKLTASQSTAERLQRDLDASREQNKFLIEERKRLLEKVAPLEGPPKEGMDEGAAPPATFPAEAGKEEPQETEFARAMPRWLSEWQDEETFETDKRLLLLLGETGLSRRPAVEVALARELGIKQTTRTIRSRIGRLQDEGLVEILRPWKEPSLPICSHLPDLVKLSEKGRQAFSALAGHAAKAADLEVLAAKYSSPEKALLVLVAADMLSANGYAKVEYADANVPAPADLVAEDRDRQAISVAVVRDDPGDGRPGRGEGRWPILHELTRGNLYVICDSRACMYRTRNQINYVLGTRPVSIHLTNLSDLQAGKRGEGKTIWLESKSRPMPEAAP